MKLFTGIGVVLLLLVGAVFVLGPAIARQRAFGSNRELIQQYDRWRTEKITLPPEALEARQFSAATLAAAGEFMNAWGAQEKAIISWVNVIDNPTSFLDPGAPDRQITPREMADPARRAELGQFQPVMDAFERLVRQPDYEMACLAEDGYGYGIPCPNYLAWNMAAKMLGLKSAAQLEEGKIVEALATAQRMLQATQGSPFDALFAQLICVSVEDLGVQAWFQAVERCVDPALLRQTLKNQLQRAQRREFMSHDLSLIVMNDVANIREMRRRGIDVDCQGRTGRELQALSFSAQADLIELQLSVERDPHIKQRIQEKIYSCRSSAAALGGNAYGLRNLFLELTGPMRFYEQARFYPNKTNIVEAHTRARVSYGKFDLLRLETARKLYTLEHGQAPASDGDLVPAYLPALPNDRFSTTKQPYRFVRHYYSIGPDAKDDGQALVYDPTNGIISTGDMTLLASK